MTFHVRALALLGSSKPNGTEYQLWRKFKPFRSFVFQAISKGAVSYERGTHVALPEQIWARNKSTVVVLSTGAFDIDTYGGEIGLSQVEPKVTDLPGPPLLRHYYLHGGLRGFRYFKIWRLT